MLVVPAQKMGVGTRHEAREDLGCLEAKGRGQDWLGWENVRGNGPAVHACTSTVDVLRTTYTEDLSGPHTVSIAAEDSHTSIAIYVYCSILRSPY